MTQGTDVPQSDSRSITTLVRERARVTHLLDKGFTANDILGHMLPENRPMVARILVQQGETLRSEFHSEAEAEAFWAHVGEDAATERSNFGEHGMAQVPDPCCCREHAGRGNLCPDCPEHSGE